MSPEENNTQPVEIIKSDVISTLTSMPGIIVTDITTPVNYNGVVYTPLPTLPPT